MSASRHVLIAGAGVGGLEAAMALRSLARDHVHITMLAPERNFTYRPLSVAEPFGHGRTVQVEIARIAEDLGIAVLRDALDAVDPEAHTITTQDGDTIPYDALVVALGARPTVAVPGALTFRGPRDVPRVAEALEALRDLPNPRIIINCTAGATWTLPLYELAFMAADWCEREGIEATVQVVTAETHALEAFGPSASEAVTALLAERGIGLRTGSVAASVEGGGLWIPIEGRIPADLVIALPYLTGPAVAGLPHDDQGFLPVDAYCRVHGVEDVFAVGDGAWHAIKQGGLATQQADVAAMVIAAWAGAQVDPQPYQPILRGMLLTGRSPLYLRHPAAEQSTGPAGEDSRVAPWWPAHKIVGLHLGPYLATHADLMVPVAA